MKKNEIVFPVVGLFGLVAFVLQWEFLLALCEALCLTGIVWLLFGKRIPLSSLPLLVMTLLIGVLIFSQPAMGKLFRNFFPQFLPIGMSDTHTQHEPSWIVCQLFFRPSNCFYRLVDALIGFCMVALLIPCVKHIAEKWQTLTALVMAGLFMFSFILWAFNVKWWVEAVGFLSAVYCVTLMVTDLFSGKKSRLFYIIFLSVLFFSLLATLVTAIIYHQRYYYGDIYVVFDWLVTLTAPLCSALFCIVWFLYDKKMRRH